MAKQTAKMGRFIKVRNNHPNVNAGDSFIALWIEGESGKEDTERCILFSEADFDRGIRKVMLPSCFKVSDMVSGRLYAWTFAWSYKMKDTGRTSWLVRVRFIGEGEDCVIRLPQCVLARAEKLAAANKEDLPKRGIIGDMLD